MTSDNAASILAEDDSAVRAALGGVYTAGGFPRLSGERSLSRGRSDTGRSSAILPRHGRVDAVLTLGGHGVRN